ncbi:zincin [Wolfiporia cocos MD-104 SS10]|uniref:Zincin n=1 Tax=Wolfiporia cocos (strain MD-104) TaxID=742152 RepID=A0A2H3JH90_WOLCO|nr:zincin [Wolfiporia cocos MD-104 SS10]
MAFGRRARRARPPPQDTEPLLHDVEHPDDEPEQRPRSKLVALVQEPLTLLTKVLLVAALVFLLLSAIFIGLFAGAQHKLNAGRNKGGDDQETPSVTITHTVVETATSSVTHTATQTDIQSQTETFSKTATQTTIRTETQTAIRTATQTETETATQTATQTTTRVATSTSTSVFTTTVEIPAPVPTGPPQEVTCLSPECIMLSSSILASLDTSQDPCENFYDFANGGWLKAHPIPSDKGVYGNFEALALQNRQLLQQILESEGAVDSFYDKQLLKKLRGLYSSCMDEDKLSGPGTEPLLAVTNHIRRLLHGKSTLVEHVHAHKDKDEVDRQGLTAAVAYLHSRGIGGLFSVDIEGDVGADPNFMTFWFSQPELGLPSKEYYEEESIVELYETVLERLLLTLAEEEKRQQEVMTSPASSNVLVVAEDRLQDWPPRPWPPWGGDDDDDGGDDDGGDDDGGDDDDDGGDDDGGDDDGGDDDGGDDDGGDHGGKGPKPTDPKKARKLAKKVVKLEKEIAKASLDLDILYQDPIATYNPVDVWVLTDALPQIDFSAYLATFTPRNFPTTVILTSTSYPKSLSKILRETDDETIEAYLVTRAALALSQLLSIETEAWLAVRSLDEQLKGLKKGAIGDRAEFCTTQVENALGFAAGRFFANETFTGDSREKGTKVITDIVSAFKKSLAHLEWMDEESAAAAAQKADAIRVKVGFPLSPDTRDPRALAIYYNRVTIREDTFFDNILSASENDEYFKWQKLGKRRDPETWEMFPSTVNAYFNPPANEIVFPAGIMQPPFFSRTWPGYMYYGSFGQVAAHELTHAFDSAGRLYNQDGKLEEWWSDVTSKGFKVRQDCIVEQYSSYTIDDGKGGKIRVNGNLTSGENIGDTGIIQAYRAWKAQYDVGYEQGTEYLLPGLNFTREQLFFISFARVWARNIKTESAVARVRTDPHSPNQYRVDGTVFNVPEFAKAFNCPANTRLNPPPEKRCLFW